MWGLYNSHMGLCGVYNRDMYMGYILISMWSPTSGCYFKEL